ncbi:MAG: hypothetical protein M3044_20050 [Thermoproteota archaeon]|nr:hypothetical protein [Thermoproteota archaeon]
MAGGIALVVIGLVFTLGGEVFSFIFQGRFGYNGCSNILDQIGSGLAALFSNGSNVCVNLQNAITISQIGLYIGGFMVVGGIVVLTIRLTGRNR